MDPTDAQEATQPAALVPSRPSGRRPDLRAHLPGLEPDRRVTDWGRSERWEGLIDRTVGDALYHLWHRVVVEGVEHVPDDGGALLVCHRAGSAALDALLVAKAIAEESRRARPVVPLVRAGTLAQPGLAMVLPKLGAVADHPANVRRLLADEGQLALAFPEEGGPRLLHDRYRVRRLRDEVLAAARASRAPVVPIAILGTEEVTPVLGRVPVPIPGVRRLPVTLPALLPARVTIRVLPPIEPGGAASVRELADQVGEVLQTALVDLFASRRSVWLG
ncbi:MAG: 1-acyl-sn-glycerol-3-phosphate acyltransferase [Solirubrobacteraceae bacterium]|nr:1-acyl-sn-glycerol-3-phosphate acyltransferase [Solirubrobacteraceae bacterium]